MPDEVTAADTTSVEEFITQGNARERGQEPPPVEPAKPAEPVKVAEAETPADEVPEADAEVGADGKPARDEQGKFKPKKTSPYWRMREATNKEATAKRERDEAKAENDRLRAENATLRAPKPSEPIAAEPAKGATEYKRYQAMPDAPKLADFESYEDYTASLSFFIARQLVTEQIDAQNAHAAERSMDDQWFARLRAAKTADPARIAGINRDTPTHPQIEAFVKRSEIGVDILCHLSDHQDLARHLSDPALHPLQRAEELGTLAGELHAKRTAAERPGPAPAKEISSAKPLIKPVMGSPPVSDADADEGDLPVEDFIRLGNKKDPSMNPAARH